MKKLVAKAAAVASAVLLAGCAAVPPNAGNNPDDPLEALNRNVYAFNSRTDRYVIRPVAETYKAVVPDAGRRAVGRFFANLGEPANMLFNLMQGKVEQGFGCMFRFWINTVAGFGGLCDVASDMGIPNTPADFGQTLGVWGVPSGCYLQLPLLGPSTVRDGIGWVGDLATYPVFWTDSWWVSAPLTVTNAVNIRAGLLSADQFIKTAVDPYVAMRNAYLQRRRAMISGSQPSDEDPGEDPEDPKEKKK